MKFLHFKCGLRKIFEVFSSPVQAFLASTLVALNATRIIHFKTINNIDNNNNDNKYNILTSAHIILTGNSFVSRT